jgi:hypothetical protein
MAEILVSDLCERCPPLLIGGFFRCREERGPPWCIVFGSFPPVFFVVLHCLVSIAIFLAITRSYVVFLRIFAR